MDERDPLTYEVIGAAIEVHRLMGPGLLESVYQLCMEHELTLRGVEFKAQTKLLLEYKGKVFDHEFLKLDIHIPGKLIVELKSVERLHPIHEAQLLTYMRLTKTHVGLIVNFNVPVLKDGIKRMVL